MQNPLVPSQADQKPLFIIPPSNPRSPDDVYYDLIAELKTILWPKGHPSKKEETDLLYIIPSLITRMKKKAGHHRENQEDFELEFAESL